MRKVYIGEVGTFFTNASVTSTFQQIKSPKCPTNNWLNYVLTIKYCIDYLHFKPLPLPLPSKYTIRIKTVGGSKIAIFGMVSDQVIMQLNKYAGRHFPSRL